MSTYFFVIFEVHYMISRYNVCVKKYMDLSLRLKSDTTLEDIESMRRTRTDKHVIWTVGHDDNLDDEFL